MVIRPPRATRKGQSRHESRDAVASVVVSAAIVVFGLRVLMGLLGVEPWSVAWSIVALPTDPLVNLFRAVDPLAEFGINRLTPADVVAFILVAFLGMTMLASIALRRD